MVYLPLLLLLNVALTANAANVIKVPLKSQLLLPKLTKPLGLKFFTNGISNLSSDPNAQLRTDAVKVVATVRAGAGQEFNDVLVDTGSAILWVGGQEAYRPGPFSEDLKTNFSVGYGIGGVSGHAWKDKVTIGEATVQSQIIGAANFTTGFALVEPIDGILGLGPTGSNGGEVDGFDTTPTFVDSLLAENSIDEPIFGIYIAPLSTDGTPQAEGEITFGGVDESRIQGDIVWLPQLPSVNMHWEFNSTSFSFGPVKLDTPTFTRTDTGVLGIGIPFEQFFDVADTFNGTFDFDNSQLAGFLGFPANATNSLPPLNFVLGNETFTIPPERYIVPKELYPSLNVTDDPNLVKTWISSAGPGAFSLGQKWLEGVYTAYDLQNHRVGFAHVVGF